MGYFANGTDGMYFDEQCSRCIHDQDEIGVGCPVALVQSLYNYDQHKEGQEKLKECLTHLVDDAGDCKMKEMIDLKYIKREDPNQMKLPGF